MADFTKALQAVQNAAPAALRPTGCEFDYRNARATHAQDDRTLMATALGYLKQGGTPRKHAVSYIALTRREAGVELLTKRNEDVLLFKGYCCRTTIGIESAIPPGEIGGRIALRTADLAANDAVTWLTDHQFIEPGQADGKGNPTVLLRNGLGMPNSDQQAAFWEWVLGNRVGELLHIFSVGPTQMQAQYSGLDGKTAPRCGWPTTWEALFAFWMSATTPSLLDQIVYLDAPCTEGHTMPDEDASAANVTTWLAFHTGNAQSAAKYYVGDPANGIPSYKDELAYCQSIADGMSWAKV